MKSSKSIERLFQEGLKDFEGSPSSKVWKGIENHLSEKRKRKIFPLWWQVASVAAIFLIFSSIGAYYYHTSKPSSSIALQQGSKFKSISTPLEVISTQYRFSSLNKNLSNLDNLIVERFAFKITEEERRKTKEFSLKDERVVDRSPSTVNQLKRVSVNSLSNSLLAFSVVDAKEDLLTTTKEKSNKKSLLDAIEENLLTNTEDKTIDKSWEIQPNVAPVFMNSFSGGNPIESSLQGKTTSNPNVSFGVNVAYAINKKMKIRTGLNQVAMGYNTQDVILSSSSPSFSIGGSSNSNLKTNLIGEITLISGGSNRNTPVNQSLNSSFGVSSSKFSPVGSINHELGFIEVPLELEYALIEKKIGIHVLGGASTFLLNNNELFFEENGKSSSIGEANNLNTFSFSANVGLGMDYSFSERVSFNLEPKLMYQINTFQNNISSFQPYFFGIYSGIKFKF